MTLTPTEPVAPDPAATNGDAGAAATQLQQDRAVAADEVGTLRVRLEQVERELSEARTGKETTEAERRELQGDRDRLRGELEKREQKLAELDTSWRDFARRHIPPERWAEIEKAEEQRSSRQVLDRAARADSLDVVADVLEQDPGFGRFLRKQVSLGTRVTKTTLPELRTLYDEVRGGAGTPAATTPAPSPSGQQDTTTTTPAPAGSGSTTQPTPPRVPAPGAPSNDPGPVFVPGKVNNLLGRHFRKKR